MLFFTRAQRRRWSLPLVVVLLLHSVFGVCTAMADVLCLEPDGTMVVEHAGEPCAGEALEEQTGQPCLDLALDAHDDHAAARLMSPVAVDLQPLFIPVLAYVFRQPEPLRPSQMATTGPPLTIHPAFLKKTTVLLI